MKKILILTLLIAVALVGNVFGYDAKIGADSIDCCGANGYIDTAGGKWAEAGFSLQGDSYYAILSKFGNYTAVAGDSLGGAYFWGWRSGSATIDIGVYDVTSGETTLVTGSVATINPTPSTHKWWGTVYNPRVALIAGHTYARAVGNETGSIGAAVRDSNGVTIATEQQSPTLGAIWNPQATSTMKVAAYVTVYHASAGGCSTPTNTLTFVDADTVSNAGRVMVHSVYGSSTLDSIAYKYGTGASISGAARWGAYPDSGTTHTIIITGLASATIYRTWSIAWSHYTSTDCSDTDYVDCKTKYVAPPPASAKLIGIIKPPLPQ